MSNMRAWERLTVEAFSGGDDVKDHGVELQRHSWGRDSAAADDSARTTEGLESLSVEEFADAYDIEV